MPATRNLTPITEDDVQALRSILANLKAGASEAHKAGNLTTFRIYQRMIKLVSPEVVKADARLEREEQARMNKQALALKNKPAQRGSTPAAPTA